MNIRDLFKSNNNQLIDDELKSIMSIYDFNYIDGLIKDDDLKGFQKARMYDEIKYHEALKNYNDIIKQAANLIRELGLRNEPLSYSIIFSYLLWNGYFSNNGKFFYSTDNLTDLNGHFGLDVILGKGCCRSMSGMLVTTLKTLSYESYFLYNISTIKKRDYLIDIVRNRENGVISPYALSSPSKTFKPEGNHVSALINRYDNYYVFDITNLTISKVDMGLIANMYNGVGETFIRPFGFVIIEDMNKLELLNLYNAINDQQLNKFISDKDVRCIIDITLNNCKNNIPMLLDFKSDINKGVCKINKLMSHSK